MKHKKLLLWLALPVLTLVVGASVAFMPEGVSPVRKADAELEAELGCGRMTADYRETDPFCTNIGLYRELKARGLAFTTDKVADEVTFVIVTGTKTQPVSNAAVNISAPDSGIRCFRAPCPGAGPSEWTGKTDRLGVVKVPRSKVPASSTLDTPGYPPQPISMFSQSNYRVIRLNTEPAAE